MNKQFARIMSGVVFWLQAGSLQATPVAEIAPEIATGTTVQELVRAERFMVAAANPHAASAGYEILRQGGSAIDALIATQLVLNLVEPQSSGIGGSGLVVYFDDDSGKVSSWEGRETAPGAVKPDLFLDQDGEPIAFYDAVVGGHSVATPGVLKLLHTLHRKHGLLPWATLFQPAIKLAREGFRVSPRLARMVAMDQERLSRYPTTKAYFFPNNQPIQEGDLLKNPDFAETLSLLARRGIGPFYQGEIARDMVTAVRSLSDRPGLLSMADLKNYRVIAHEPVCQEYRQKQVCGMGPPSSGGLTVGQTLGLLSHYDLAGMGPDDPHSWRLIGDASRLAFADRGQYIADPAFTVVPHGLLDESYVRQRSKLLATDKALAEVAPGSPPGSHQLSRAADSALELPSTSHISIVDGQGNAVAMTSTIENAFGSRLMVRGFLLNNSMTDFSLRPTVNGKAVANAIAPGKRPLSSMSPTIVLQDNEPYMVLGSAGGARIIGHVLKTLIAHLDWGMPVDKAISLPHRINMSGVYELEEGTDAEKLVKPLEEMGYQVSVREINSSLHAIVIKPSGLEGGADPRREGAVMGE